MQQVIKSAEESLDRVLKYYQKQDTQLSYRPSFVYLDEVCPLRPDALLRVCDEFELTFQTTDWYLKNLSAFLYKEVYGLNVSEGAIEEVADIMKKKIDIPEEYKNLEADIIIFQPYKDYLDRIDSDQIIAHEVWHLIERENDVLKKTPFIIEGTATYAMKRFREERCDISIEDCEGFFEMMYHGAANVVQNYVESKENPYKSLLGLPLREQIQNALLGKVKPILLEKFKKSVESEDVKMVLLYALRQIPEFQSLEGNLTSENLLNVYQKMGANKLVNELRDQDLSTLLHTFRLIGF